MNIRRFLTISAIAFALPLSAQAHGGRHQDPDASFGLRAIERLELTAEQRSEVRKIGDARRDRMRANADAVRDARRALADLQQAEKYDAAAVARHADVIGKATAERIRLQAETRQQLAAVLTPAQLEKLQAACLDKGARDGRRGDRHG
jgi:periplasmic protein CpxP/Spy